MRSSGVILLDSDTGQKIVQRKCKEEGLSVQLIRDLVAAEQEQEGKLRKRGLFDRFDEILEEAYEE